MFPLGGRSHRPDAPRRQPLRYALLELPRLGEAGLRYGNLGVNAPEVASATRRQVAGGAHSTAHATSRRTPSLNLLKLGDWLPSTFMCGPI